MSSKQKGVVSFCCVFFSSNDRRRGKKLGSKTAMYKEETKNIN